MRAILRFVFVVIPTAALAGAVVVAVSHKSAAPRTVAADGDLQRDLQLASTSSLELAPTAAPLATVSAIEAPPAAAPERTTRTKRSNSGPRAVRSRKPAVKAAPETELAAAPEESQPVDVAELASSTEAKAEAPAEGGGVPLPRPTASPVDIPVVGTGSDVGAGSGGERGPDTDRGGGSGGILGGIFGAVIRGGGVDGDHCEIHTGRRRSPRGVYGMPSIMRPTPPIIISRGSLMDRVRAAQAARPDNRSRDSFMDRVRAARRR